MSWLVESFSFFLGATILGAMPRPSPRLFELRYIFLFTTLIGYGGYSALLVFSESPPASFLLVPRFVPLVLLYGGVCSLLFWVGYHTTPVRQRRPGRPVSTGHRASILRVRAPSAWLLAVLAALPLMAAVVKYGLEGVFGASPLPRGYDQFEERSWVHYIEVLSSALCFPLSVLAGLAWRNEAKRLLYVATPVLLFAYLAAIGSRAMFLPFVVFAFGTCLQERRRTLVIRVFVAGAVAVFGFVLALAIRELIPGTGLDRFRLLLEDEPFFGTQRRGAIERVVMATSSLPVATKVFEVGPRAEGGRTLGYLLRQLPIPSFLLPSSVPKTSLSHDLGIYSTGLPYPLLGEMWVFFAWWGTLFYALMGWAAARIDHMTKRLASTPSGAPHRYLAASLYGLGLWLIIVAFHSGLRPGLRPWMYFGVGLGIYHVLRLRRHPSPARRRQRSRGAVAVGR